MWTWIKTRLNEGSSLRGILDAFAGLGLGSYVVDITSQSDTVIQAVDAAKDLGPESLFAVSGYLLIRGLVGFFTKEAGSPK